MEMMEIGTAQNNNYNYNNNNYYYHLNDINRNHKPPNEQPIKHAV